MNVALSPHDRRIAVRGVVAIAILVLVGRVIPGLRDWASERVGAVGQLQLESLRTEQSARDTLATRHLLVRSRARLADYDSAALDAASYTRASAMLATVVRDAADAAEAQLGVVQLRADSSATGRLSHVFVRATVTGNLESLALFLESLEGGPELLAVRELSITQPEPGIPSERPESLRGEVLVEAVFRTPISRASR